MWRWKPEVWLLLQPDSSIIKVIQLPAESMRSSSFQNNMAFSVTAYTQFVHSVDACGVAIEVAFNCHFVVRKRNVSLFFLLLVFGSLTSSSWLIHAVTAAASGLQSAHEWSHHVNHHHSISGPESFNIHAFKFNIFDRAIPKCGVLTQGWVFQQDLQQPNTGEVSVCCVHYVPRRRRTGDCVSICGWCTDRWKERRKRAFCFGGSLV